MSVRSPVGILLVENNPSDAEAIDAAVGNSLAGGSALIRVGSLGDAVSRIEAESFDLVLLDLMLPDSEGVDTFLRFHEREPHVPVLVLTDRNHEDAGIEALQGGAQDYLLKDELQPVIVERAVRNAIQRQQVAAELRENAEQLRLVTNTANLGLAIVDESFRYRYVNRAWTDFLELPNQNLVGESLPEQLGEIYAADMRPNLELAFRGRRIAQELLMPPFTPDGPRRCFAVSYEPQENQGERLVMITMVDVSEREQAHLTLLARHQQLQTLHAISEQVFTSPDLSAVVDGVLDKALSLGSFDIGVVRLRAAEGDVLRAEALRGYRNLDASRMHGLDLHIPQHGVVNANVLVKKSSVVVEDVLRSPGLSEFKNEGVRSAILVPIMAAEEVLGIIQLGNRTPRRFSPDLLRTLEALGHHVGIAFQKARLERDMQESLDRLRALHEANTAITSTLETQDILEILLAKLETFLPMVAAATVRLVQPASGALKALACRGIPREGWIGRELRGPISRRSRLVVESGAPVVIRNIEADPSSESKRLFRRHGLVSYLGVPLIAHEKIVGVLGLYGRREYDFSAAEIDLVNTVAGQAAMAIHNAQLFDAAKRANEDAMALREINLAITSSLDLNTQIDVLFDKMLHRFRNCALVLRLLNKSTGQFEPLACRNLDEQEWKRMMPTLGTGGLHHVVASQQPVAIVDLQNDPRVAYPEFLRRHGLISFLGVPLTFQRDVMGVLGLFARERREFGREETEFMCRLAEQAAIAIHNSQTYEQLRNQARDLERANAVKDEFLSVMSHELRTPLNITMGYVEMMRDGLIGPITSEQKLALHKVQAQSAEQLRMINDILETTRLETREMVVERQRLNLGEFVKSLESDFAAIHDGGEPQLIWEYRAGALTIITDGRKLRQVVQNLVGNALKFTERGKITVSFGLCDGVVQKLPACARTEGDPRGPDWLQIRVSDTGVGIPADKLDTVFEKFRQVDSSPTRLHGGLGLGLYIVRQFIQLLGGEITVDSIPGRGSTFTVTVPVSA
jgi:PAS domain S-box-containing protein